MKTFTYTIRDELGIHARPAGLVVAEAKKYTASVEIVCGTRKASAKKLMAIMAMAVKCGEEITVTADGADEEQAIAGMKALFEASL